MSEFAGDYYQVHDRVIHFRSQMLQLNGSPLDDISDDEHAEGTLNTIHQLIGNLKQHGYGIHLSVSGGRRLMGLLASSVAALHFERDDHVWHLYTPKEIQQQADEGALMHVPVTSGIKLIQVPFTPGGDYASSSANTFRSAESERQEQMDAQEHDRCQSVVDRLTPRQLDVLRAFAQGLSQQGVSQALNISMKTVDNHKSVILDHCREIWHIDVSERTGYHFLHTTFEKYFNNRPR
jgi:CRISPR-associated protein Csx14